MGFIRVLKAEFVILIMIVAVGSLVGLARTLGSTDATSGYEVVGADLEPFRAAFNAASGDVRAVLLVGPT